MRKLLWLMPLAAFALSACKEEPPKQTAPAGGATQACIDVGTGVPAFQVKAITGSEKGQALCYV